MKGNYLSPSYVTVVGKKNFIIAGCNNGGYTYSSVFFPIRRNQSLTHTTSSGSSNIYYLIKYKADLILHMPDWNNATMQQFYQNQTAEVDGYIYADCGSNSGQGYIQINGNHTITICQQSTTSQSFSSVFQFQLVALFI